MKVHLLHPPDESSWQFLQEALAPGVHAASSIQLSAGAQFPQPPEFEVLVAGRPDRFQLAASPYLHSLVIPWAGLPATTRLLLRDFPHLKVYNLHHNAMPTAEMAIALLLAAARFIIPADRALRRGDWTPRYRPDPAMTLGGKTALVLGFGQVGQRIGRACHALGMRVMAIRRNPGKASQLDYPVQVYGLQALPELLPQVHALLIALPATDETEALIGAAQLHSMPPGGVLVNVGRGAIVDQKALYEHLRSGHLRAAGLDVWYNYPADEMGWANTPPADYPFGDLENVVLSPHRAGSAGTTGGASATEILRMQALAELLLSLAQGKEPASRVDVLAGY